jgi:glyoxylase-like metal-dependent hydrolase (beta-lactamase superfamily II)
MLFRQLFDPESSTYTYLLASRRGSEALIIDPVIERTTEYLELLRSLKLRLKIALDTHTHADHVTGLSALRCATGCATMLSTRSPAPCVTMRFSDGDDLEIEGLRLRALYTPGHTDDSVSFVMRDRVFTGDALLIHTTGRTDFQNGDPYAAYDSIFNKLLKLPDDTRVYPGHDYEQREVSTIGEERRANPRLQVSSAQEYADLMNSLNLPAPRSINFAVPANLRCGELAAPDPG